MIKSNHHVPINSLLDEHLIPNLTPPRWHSPPSPDSQSQWYSQADLPKSTFADLIASLCLPKKLL